MRILVFNCGSSSLKFELIEVDAAGGRGESLARGLVENIGTPGQLHLSPRRRSGGTR